MREAGVNQIDELKVALKTAREQQAAQEQAWRSAMEEEKMKKTTQADKLIEKVKGMEVKQADIRNEMEQKLINLQEQAQEKYKADARRV